MNRNVSFHVLHARQCNRISDGKSTKREVKRRKIKVLCNKWSEKSSEDFTWESFVKIRALALLEYTLPRNTALQLFFAGLQEKNRE